MDTRFLQRETVFAFAGRESDRGLIDALRRERRHAAIVFLSTGMALGIGFALALDMVVATTSHY